MAVTTQEGKKLFSSVDPTWNGRQGFNVMYPTLYATQAHDFVEYLLAYLAHSHGPKVYRWFSPDVVAEAKSMGWDDKKNQLISPDGLDPWNTLQTLDIEWCVASPAAANPMSMAIDLDNVMLPSFNTITQLAMVQPGAPSIAPTPVQLVNTTSSIGTHDNLTVASMVDTRLSALKHTCALLPQILQRLNALSPPPQPLTGHGSTSTQTVDNPGNPETGSSLSRVQATWR